MQFNSRCLSRAVTRDVRESTQGKQPRAREPRGDIRAAIFPFARGALAVTLDGLLIEASCSLRLFSFFQSTSDTERCTIL